MTLPAIIALVSLTGIAAIWLGYPLLVWAIGQVFPSALRKGAKSAPRSVSVLLATRDAAEIVRARIQNLLATEHPGDLIEIVVALDADGAQSAPQELENIDGRIVVVIGDQPGGKAAALNAGVRAASGEILVMADAQQRFEPNTIPELVAAMEDVRFGAVSGALELGDSHRLTPVNLYWALEKWLRNNECRVHSSVGVTGAIYATRRSLWPVIPAGTLLDDVFVPMSLVLSGHRVGFTYAARAHDVRTFDSRKEGVRKTRTLTGVLQLRHLLPGLMSVRRNPIFLQFVAHKLLRLLTPFLALVLAASLGWIGIDWLAHTGTVQRLLVAAAVLVLIGIPVTRRKILGLVNWIIALQLATARAVMNGMTGRWGVWSKTGP